MTSYKALYQDGRESERWNRLHPGQEPRQAYVHRSLEGESGPVVAALDYAAARGTVDLPRWVGPDYVVLGTDGFGRSEARQELRRFFEVDAENIALAALNPTGREGPIPTGKTRGGYQDPGLDAEKPPPVSV